MHTRTVMPAIQYFTSADNTMYILKFEHWAKVTPSVGVTLAQHWLTLHDNLVAQVGWHWPTPGI